MDHKEYQENALRTESQIDSVQADVDLLRGALCMYIGSGILIDCIKKNTFYGSEFPIEKIANAFAHIKAGSLRLELNDILPLFSASDRDAAAGFQAVAKQYESSRMGLSINPRLFHGLTGHMTESVELAEVLSDVLLGNNTDVTNIGEELADASWYGAILCDELGLDMDTLLQNNIDKLRKRFPEKFDAEQAQESNRDLDAEREILERE